jgi:hypothetical protein
MTIKKNNRSARSLVSFKHAGLMSVVISFVFMAGIQSVDAQSQLSLLCPTGLQVQQNTGTSFMMGGTSNAVADQYNCMLRNPANLGSIDKTVFSSQYLYDYNRISESGSHTNFFNGYPEQISLGIPVGIFGALGLSYSLTGITDAKYRQNAKYMDYDTSTIEYLAGIVSSGGTENWQIGWGREFAKLRHLRIGAAFERIYFASSLTTVRSITDESKTAESRDSTYCQLRCNALRGGVMLPYGKFTYGLSGEYFFKGYLHKDNAIYSTSSDTTNSYGYTSAVSVDQKKSSTSLRLPPSLTGGVAYSITKEWLAAADLSVSFWSYYNSNGLLYDKYVRSAAALSVSAGCEYVPVPAIMTPKYVETIQYGAGFRYTELSTTESSEFAVSLGTGLPIGKNAGLLTLGLEMGRRTNGHFSDLSENFAHVSIGFNGCRKWIKSSTGSNY